MPSRFQGPVAARQRPATGEVLAPLAQHLVEQPAVAVTVVVDRLDLGEQLAAGGRQLEAEPRRQVAPAAARLAGVAEPGLLVAVPPRRGTAILVRRAEEAQLAPLAAGLPRRESAFDRRHLGAIGGHRQEHRCQPPRCGRSSEVLRRRFAAIQESRSSRR